MDHAKLIREIGKAAERLGKATIARSVTRPRAEILERVVDLGAHSYLST